MQLQIGYSHFICIENDNTKSLNYNHACVCDVKWKNAYKNLAYSCTQCRFIMSGVSSKVKGPFLNTSFSELSLHFIKIQFLNCLCLWCFLLLYSFAVLEIICSTNKFLHFSSSIETNLNSMQTQQWWHVIDIYKKYTDQFFSFFPMVGVDFGINVFFLVSRIILF